MMPSYRLLRSNKESGPYSLNDLVVLGLKPYDLVWVDGRSAAWRYPSEIAELKEFAPIVEEQPYDRFYKKPSESASIESPVPHQEILSEKKEVKEQPVQKAVKETPTRVPSYPVQPKKQVFVSLPEKNDGVNKHQYQQYQPKPKPVQEQPKPVDERSYSPINIQESEEAKLETKYTQSLDDIKEMYINTLVQRKTRNKRKELAKKYFKPVTAALVLLVSGIVIGYIITKNVSTVQAVQPISTVVPQNNAEKNSLDEIPGLKPEEKQISDLQPGSENDLAPKKDELIKPKKENKISTDEARPVEKAKNKISQVVFVPDDEVAKVEKRNVEIDPATGERKKTTRHTDDEVLVTKENNKKDNNTDRVTFIETAPKDLRKLVSVKSNNYIRGAFGGIKDMTLTISNNSEYLIDEVKVQVQIMRPSEQPLRTDIITLKNIGPNGKVTVKVPDSQRGIRVDYRIKNIESRQFEKGTAGL